MSDAKNPQELAKIAYEAYRSSLHSRTSQWLDLKNELERYKDQADDEFDLLVYDIKDAYLNQYFMGDYEEMPPHSKLGWQSFACCAANGPESAWQEYKNTARINYHAAEHFTIPDYAELSDAQQQALAQACKMCALNGR